MKLIPLLTMAAFAAAVPTPKGCTPGTYSCTADLKGWQVCNIDRTWVNGSPYCVPPGFHF
ncbi:hypothetical protein FocTR4_00016595 [Fusarium oxysporum f. sp. cubense]|uniref:Uncharacterized protein n=1 Tax=Fusarium oxysporum f. sp. cubense TaxID=61366 RepID=A0A5C6SCU3_FUSOC|nr:hypothetical protein FocTR4_00016595 [Fusarium oxysporum f. sp. cubense]